MRIIIDKENVSIVFENDDEKKEFLDSDLFKKMTNLVSEKESKKIAENFDWEKWLEKHPLNRKFDFERTIPNQIQDPPIDISPYIDDPVHFPSTTEPYRQSWITVTQDTERRGGCDATPKFNGCDATPRYGKATVDWLSKYPCDATPAFLKDNGKKKRQRK